MIEFLAKLPSTNARIFVTIIMAFMFVTTVMVAEILGHAISQGTQITIGSFLTVWAGLDVTQFKIKRDSWENTSQPPQTPKPDVEDQAGGKNSGV